MESLIHENAFRDGKFGPKNILEDVHLERFTRGHKWVGGLSSPSGWYKWKFRIYLKRDLRKEFDTRRLRVKKKRKSVFLVKRGTSSGFESPWMEWSLPNRLHSIYFSCQVPVGLGSCCHPLDSRGVGEGGGDILPPQGIRAKHARGLEVENLRRHSLPRRP